jgi:hypothetical protein
MNDCSWMYRDSPKGLYMKNYCKRVEGFINFTLLNLIILVEMKLDVHVQNVKIKSFISQMLWWCIFKKKKLYENTYVGLHKEKYMFLIKTMLERTIDSTSSSSNIHKNYMFLIKPC